MEDKKKNSGMGDKEVLCSATSQPPIFGPEAGSGNDSAGLAEAWHFCVSDTFPPLLLLYTS